MDDPLPPHTHPALPNETHTVPVHYQRDPATSVAVHIVDLDTGTAVCGYDTSGPGWALAAMAISACCLDCMMIYQQRQLAEKLARWEAGEMIQDHEPDLWSADGDE